MTVPIEQFRKLTEVFDPLFRNAKGGDGLLGPYFVREAHEEFRDQLKTSLVLNERGKFLLAGQPGCGKTTLLLTIADELRAAGRLVAFVDLETTTAVQDLGLAELNLSATAEVLRAADSAHIALSEEGVASCAEWLAKAHGTPVVGSAAEVSEGILGLLKSARESADLRRTLRELVARGGDNDPHTLLAQLLEDAQDQRPVVILDGLDKLPPDQAREFFLGSKSKPMADTPGASILTIPLSVVYEPVFASLSERYNNADNAVLPAIRVYDFDERTSGPRESKAGIELVRRIVVRRAKAADDGLLTPEAIEKAILSSCGNIRELGRLLQSSIVKATVQKANRVEEPHVEAAIIDQRETFRRSYQPRFYPVLKKVEDRCVLDNVDDVGKLLLYGLWVMEFRNGRTWYHLPEAAKRLLAQLDREVGV